MSRAVIDPKSYNEHTNITKQNDKGLQKIASISSTLIHAPIKYVYLSIEKIDNKQKLKN